VDLTVLITLCLQDELVGYYKDHPDEDPVQHRSNTSSPDGEDSKRSRVDA
jgi:hypothetical protein